MSRQYLEGLRSRSCYPTFRGFVQVFTLLGYLGAGVIAITAIFSGITGSILIGIAVAIIVALMIRVAKEMSLMLADIADATIDNAFSGTRAPETAAVGPAPINHEAFVDSAANEAELMAHYAITLENGNYKCGSYQFGSLAKALTHARHQRSLRRDA